MAKGEFSDVSESSLLFDESACRSRLTSQSFPVGNSLEVFSSFERAFIGIAAIIVSSIGVCRSRISCSREQTTSSSKVSTAVCPASGAKYTSENGIVKSSLTGFKDLDEGKVKITFKVKST